jgi:hypothetical protein
MQPRNAFIAACSARGGRASPLLPVGKECELSGKQCKLQKINFLFGSFLRLDRKKYFNKKHFFARHRWIRITACIRIRTFSRRNSRSPERLRAPAQLEFECGLRLRPPMIAASEWLARL